eukprot:jgi/Ulvmu1/11901/UM081_0060.1
MGKPKVSSQPWLPGSLQSEYGMQYPPKQVTRHGNQGRGDRSAQETSLPFTATSTSRADFKEVPHIRSETSVKPDKPWPKRHFDGSTTYRVQHGEKKTPASREQGYCQLRSKQVDTNDYGIHGRPHYKEDFCGWPGSLPAEPAQPPTRPMPELPLSSATDYSLNFTPKQPTRPTARKPHCPTTDPSLRFSGCTTYGKEFVPKRIPARVNACMDRPWMRCDSCPPTEVPTPPGGLEAGGGLQERTWTKPPYAIARAVLDDRTEHKTKFRHW